MSRQEEVVLAESRKRERQERIARISDWAAFHGRMMLLHYRIAREHNARILQCKDMLVEEINEENNRD